MTESQMQEKEQAELAAKAQGRIEGLVAGKAQGILTVRKARGLPMGEAVRARVLGCQDLHLLDPWLVRAAIAASAAEVIAA